MRDTTFHGRRAATIENDDLRLTVLPGGGHIAELFDKQAGVSPLWVPGWPSIEPSAFSPAITARYGGGVDASLLASIMGHNLCLDLFGGPSAAEAAAGLTPHGEASIAEYELASTGAALTLAATLPQAGLRVQRELALHGRHVHVRETVSNTSSHDRPIGWTQHVTLGPPFLQPGATEIRASATRSKVYEGNFGPGDYLAPGAEFTWPLAPRIDGGTSDRRRYTDAPSSSAYTAHLMDTGREHAYFVAFTPAFRLAFGYVWRRADFPWLGIWEENRSRPLPPWDRAAVTCGMEFGVSPFPETRVEMIDRGRLFETPTYRWVPARGHITVEYWIVTRTAATIPEVLDWPA